MEDNRSSLGSVVLLSMKVESVNWGFGNSADLNEPPFEEPLINNFSLGCVVVEESRQLAMYPSLELKIWREGIGYQGFFQSYRRRYFS